MVELSSSPASPTLALREPASGRKLASLTEPGSFVLSLIFSPDGRTLAAGTVGGESNCRMSPPDKTARPPGHCAAVGHWRSAPDGQSLVSGGYDSALKPGHEVEVSCQTRA